MKATASAPSNIALVKYWGKRDERLILPQNGSISVTLDGLFTTTTVEFDKRYDRDVFILGGTEQGGEELERVVGGLNLVRELAGIQEQAKVVSVNSFPTAAGLASSSSGAAALTVAAAAAAGLDLSARELSILSRRQSGASTRSILGGFVEWTKGERADGTDSYAVQLAPPEHWPEFRVIVAIVSTAAKRVKSRAGMAQSVANCPLYGGWLDSVKADLQAVREGIASRDIVKVGETAEHNALKMHAVMMTTKPAIIYWQPATLEVVHAVRAWRDGGLACWFTIDGGPQVKVLCEASEEQEVVSRLKEVSGVKAVIVSRPGPDAHLTDKHLF